MIYSASAPSGDIRVFGVSAAPHSKIFQVIKAFILHPYKPCREAKGTAGKIYPNTPFQRSRLNAKPSGYPDNRDSGIWVWISKALSPARMEFWAARPLYWACLKPSPQHPRKQPKPLNS